MATDREERIRQLAHEIWEREGPPHGRDAEHWRLATEAYEAERASSRLDDAGVPIEAAHSAEPSARRGRTSQGRTASPAPETVSVPKRKRRTKAEMAAAAAGVAGAAAAVAATMAVTKRRRGTKAQTTDEASPTPAADVALRRPRGSKSGTSLSGTEPEPVAVISKAATGVMPDPSANGLSDVAPGAVPDPGAERPSDAALKTVPENASDEDPSRDRTAD
jgi:hypothetical protein